MTNVKSQNSRERIISLQDNHEEINSNMLLLAKKLETIQQNVKKLSLLQKEVLKLRQKGFTINEIALELDITPNTVRTHINRASKKLGVDKLINYLEF